MDHNSKCKMEKYQTFRGTMEENLHDLGLIEEFLDMASKDEP